MHVDWVAIADSQESLAWYVARYGGGQNFEWVTSLTIDEVSRAADHIQRFVKAEVPNPSPGHS